MYTLSAFTHNNNELSGPQRWRISDETQNDSVIVCFVLMAFVCLWTEAPAFSQAAGSISGVVQDPTGALIPGAEVSVKHLATNAELKTVSSELGHVYVPDCSDWKQFGRVTAAYGNRIIQLALRFNW